MIEWSFANGTSAVFKQDKTKPGQVFYVLSDDHGIRYLSEEQSIHARLALETIGGSGLRDMNGPELEQWLNTSSISNFPYYTFWNKGVQGDSATEDFPTAMNLLHVTLTEARVHPAARAHFLERNKQELKQRNSSTMKAWQDKVSELLFQGDPAFRVLTESEVEETSAADMETIYQQHYSGAQQYQLSVVGDITEEEVLQTVMNAIATLPKSKISATQGRDFPRITKPEVAEVDGSGREAAIISHKLTLDKQALKDVGFDQVAYLHLWLRSVLMAELREKEGLVYSVNAIVEGGYTDLKDYSLTIEMACDPKKVDILKTRLNEILQQHAANPIDPKRVAAWIEERQGEIKAAIEHPGELAGGINTAAMTGIALDDILDVELRSELKDPKVLNEILSVLLSEKAVATTLVWMP